VTTAQYRRVVSVLRFLPECEAHKAIDGLYDSAINRTADVDEFSPLVIEYEVMSLQRQLLAEINKT
jgi:hypothetical protein